MFFMLRLLDCFTNKKKTRTTLAGKSCWSSWLTGRPVARIRFDVLQMVAKYISHLIWHARDTHILGYKSAHIHTHKSSTTPVIYTHDS